MELAELQRKVGITFIFVTHNQAEALALADRIAVMNLGVIEQADTPMNIYEHPKSRFVADFIGSMNLFQGKVKEAGTDYTVVELVDGNEIRFTGRGGMTREQKVTYCIRPERMKISLLDAREYENSVKGRISSKSYLGDSTHYLVKLDDGKNIRVIAQNYLLQLDNEFYETGEEVFINWSQTSGELIYALEN